MSEEPPADMNGVVRPVIGMSAEMPAVTNPVEVATNPVVADRAPATMTITSAVTLTVQTLRPRQQKNCSRKVCSLTSRSMVTVTAKVISTSWFARQAKW